VPIMLGWAVVLAVVVARRYRVDTARA